MNSLEKAEEIAEKIRQEPYHLLKNDCIIKSARLKRECQALGIPAGVVVCIGRGRAKLFGRWLTIPVLHAWAKVEGKRVETSRPIGTSGLWSIIPVHIKPIVAIWF